ncbi:hypothetical protein ACIRD9_41780 [Streptomyces violaceus]|uniref:hypothetical protein n=1 Tax=Streptomyces violaceus TaxID=1936 RepID=UPI0037F3455D
MHGMSSAGANRSSALAAFTRPATGSLINADIANWGTLTGRPLCFSLAGLFQLGEHPSGS